MGVGIRDKGKTVQGAEPPVHGWIGGQAGFYRMDIWGEIPEAVLYGIKAGEGTEQGEVGRPDMGGDENGLRAGFQRNLQ